MDNEIKGHTGYTLGRFTFEHFKADGFQLGIFIMPGHTYGYDSLFTIGVDLLLWSFRLEVAKASS